MRFETWSLERILLTWVLTVEISIVNAWAMAGLSAAAAGGIIGKIRDGDMVTIDAKNLHPGEYRGGHDRWEFRPPGGGWKPVQLLADPTEIAFKKAKVLGNYIDQTWRRAGERSLPDVIRPVMACATA